MTKADAVNGILRVDADVVYVGLNEDFLLFELEDGSQLHIRWSSVDSFSFNER